MYVTSWGRLDHESAEALDDHGHALATAAAHRLQAELLVVELEAVDQRAGDAGAGHAEGVAHGDGAAVHVQLVLVDAEVAGGRDDLRGERLVDLEQVDVADAETGPLQRLL